MIKATLLLGLLAAIVTTLTPAWETPPHFPAPAHDFAAEPLDSARVQLGRALFYDPILSRDTSVACASCHSPYNAFAHTDHALSHGIGDSVGTRNAPALFNLAWRRSFTWDGAAHALDVHALAPLADVGEMDLPLATVVGRLRENPRYASGFAEAYPDGEVTGQRVLKCLAQFQLTLVSAGAKYDRVAMGTAAFTEQELLGQAVFEEHCAGCHVPPLFTGFGAEVDDGSATTSSSFRQNGLPLDGALRDFGRMGVTGLPADSLAFRVPSLRNLRYTAPYMHDGRLASIGAVLRHYAELPVARREALGMPATELDAVARTDLVAFLRTLDDEDFVLDERHHYPRAFFSPPPKD